MGSEGQVLEPGPHVRRRGTPPPRVLRCGKILTIGSVFLVLSTIFKEIFMFFGAGRTQKFLLPTPYPGLDNLSLRAHQGWVDRWALGLVAVDR